MATLSAPGLAAPTLGAAANAALAATAAAKAKLTDKAKSAAQDFEAVFLNTLFQQMFSSIGKGPFGGGSAAGVWRSVLTDEYAKSFARAGGIGIADHVQRALLAQQEIR
jgi:Rod binding domain-containing protein